MTKVREMRGRLTVNPDLARDDQAARLRLEHYRESLAMLDELTPEHPLVRQLRFELEALHELPPRPDSLSRPLDGARL